jgi:hypothetical protein
MKRIGIIALAAMLSLGAIAPSAHAVGVFGTWWEAPGDSEDDGLGLGIRSKRNFTPLLSMDMRVSWINFTSDSNLFPIEATGMVKLGMLYAGVGAGYYIFDSSPDVDNNFGFYGLGGIDIGLKSFSIFGEAKWTSLSTELKDVDPDFESGDVDADGWSVNIGAMFDVPGM